MVPAVAARPRVSCRTCVLIIALRVVQFIMIAVTLYVHVTYGVDAGIYAGINGRT